MDLEDLNLVACDDAGDPPADAPIALRHLQLHSCGIRCTRAALATVRATEIMVDAEVFDARLLGGQAGLMAVHDFRRAREQRRRTGDTADCTARTGLGTAGRDVDEIAPGRVQNRNRREFAWSSSARPGCPSGPLLRWSV